MNAWIDLMTYLDEDHATTAEFVSPGEIVTIEMTGMKQLRERRREIHDALIECAAFVDWRRIEGGRPAYLCLAWPGHHGERPAQLNSRWKAMAAPSRPGSI